MKKKMILIGIGILIIFIPSILFSSFMPNSNLAIRASMGIGVIYFIILAILSYVKNIYNYFKTGKILNNSSLALVISLLYYISTKSISSSLFLAQDAFISTKEIEKTNVKLSVLAYTLFNIAIWSFLGFIFYIFVFQNEKLDNIGEILLTISFICIILDIFVIFLGVIFNALKRKNKQ